MSGTVVCDKTCLQCLTANKSTTVYKRKTYEKTKIPLPNKRWNRRISSEGTSIQNSLPSKTSKTWETLILYCTWFILPLWFYLHFHPLKSIALISYNPWSHLFHTFYFLIRAKGNKKPNKYRNGELPQCYETNQFIGTQGKECRFANFCNAFPSTLKPYLNACWAVG